jgi:hypothetical protein
MTLQAPLFQEEHLAPRLTPRRIRAWPREKEGSEIGHLLFAERRPSLPTLCKLFLHSRRMIPQPASQLEQTLPPLQRCQGRADLLRLARRGVTLDTPPFLEQDASLLWIARQRLGRPHKIWNEQEDHRQKEGHHVAPDELLPKAAPWWTIASPFTHVNGGRIVIRMVPGDRSPGS